MNKPDFISIEIRFLLVFKRKNLFVSICSKIDKKKGAVKKQL